MYGGEGSKGYVYMWGKGKGGTWGRRRRTRRKEKGGRKEKRKTAMGTEKERKSHWFHCVAHMHSLSLSAD
jgi:hypothetical protein